MRSRKRKLKMSRRHLALTSILLFATSLTFCSPVSRSSHAKAQTFSPTKISSDLARQIRTNPGARAKVIIQLNQRPSSLFDSLLTTFGGSISRRLINLNVSVVDLPLNAIEALTARDEVRFISPDRQLGMFGHVETTTGLANVRTQTTSSLGGLLTTTTVFDGHGIGIAIVDSGIDAQHVVFRDSLGLSRVTLNRDFTGENRTDDAYGHGTHVASIAAGNNQISSGAYTGIAPGANLINLRILDSQGIGSTSNLLAALDWLMTYHSLYGIRVVNMSVGTPAIDSYWNDPLCQAVRRATDAGIVVVAAAGNNGKSSSGEKIYGQIHSPGNEPSAITVGASNSFGTDARSDDTVTTYSSRGPTRSYRTDENAARHYDNLLKPDLTAPGNKIVGAAGVGNYLLATHPELDANVSTVSNRRMMYMSGTSMAAPIVTGTAALLLQANPTLTPSLVKAILMYTAQPLSGSNMFEQGAGEINVEGAMRLAKLISSDLTTFTRLGAPLLVSSEYAVETTLSGQTFCWARGIILNHIYATGLDLVTKYQVVYARGSSLGDGVVENSSSQAVNAARMTSGVLLGTNI